MDTRTYQTSPTALHALEAKLATHSLIVDLTASGEAKDGGWDVSWDSTVGPNFAKITITCVHHPMLEEGAFWSTVAENLGRPVS